MNYEEIKEIAKTMNKKAFKEKYLHNNDEGESLLLISDYFYDCPNDIENCINYKGYGKCNFNCKDCWLKFIDNLYSDIEIEKSTLNVQDEELVELDRKTKVIKNTYTSEELINIIKTSNLKNYDAIDCMNRSFQIIKELKPLAQEPLQLTKKYFIGDTEIKEGMKLRIQNEDPYENKFEHIGMVKKELDKLYLKEDDSEVEFPLEDCSIKILEIINE